MRAARLDCGCRRRSARRNGHRPQCQFFDPVRHVSHKNRQRFLRRWNAQEGLIS